MIEITRALTIDERVRTAFLKLSEAQMCFKTFYGVKKIATALESLRKETQGKLRDGVKEFANKDEKGEPMLVDGKWDIPEDKKQDYIKTMSGVVEEKVQIDWDQLDPDKFEGVTFTAVEWDLLSPFLSQK